MLKSSLPGPASLGGFGAEIAACVKDHVTHVGLFCMSQLLHLERFSQVAPAVC